MKSSINWIDEIPYGWIKTRIKHISLLFNGDRGDNYPKSSDFLENGVPFIRTENLVNFTIQLENMSYISDKKYMELGGAKIIAGDIIYCLRGSVGKNAIVDIDGGTIASSLMVIRPTAVLSKYLMYLLNSPFETIQRSIFTNGSVSKNLSTENVGNYIVYIPPDNEMQREIVQYLDSKSHCIDKAISLNLEIIEKLKEYRQAIITEAVTKGINKDAKMKDSGVEWIGEIPKTWRCNRAKIIFTESHSKGNTTLELLSATQDEGVIPKSQLDGVVQVSEDADLTTFKTVHIDDFVISLRSFQGGFELAHYEGVITPAYTVFRAKEKIGIHYFKYLFKSKSFISKINSLTVGIREGKNILFDDFANILIPIPSFKEQEEISEYLDKKCAAIDKTIAAKESIITKLDEYKKSLIYEYVTGKKQVSV